MASNPAKTCRLRFDYTGGYPGYPKDAASRIPSDPGKADLHAVFPGCIAGDSHPGFEREKNEDSYLICTRPDGHLSLAAVADGVGGRPCGEIASRLCLSTLFEQWSRMAWNVPSLDPEKGAAFLAAAAQTANERICAESRERKLKEPMCTTLAAILFTEKKAVILHAGDSRIYRVRPNAVECLTRDHTLMAEMLQSGALSPEDARFFPFAHMLSNSLGAEETERAECAVFDHLPGDRFLLCSDGLTDVVKDSEISSCVLEEYDPADTVRRLLERALQRGGPDNVTLVAVYA